MVGVGTSCTDETLRRSLEAQEAGAESVLVVAPPYNKPNQSGLMAHFQYVADRVDVPVCLYHVPGRSGYHMSVEQIVECASHPKISSIKEASGDLRLFSSCRMAAAADVLSGDDLSYLASLAVGGRGVISVISNLFPSEWVTMTNLFLFSA